MEKVWLIRYSEIGIKGKNRRLFEKRLASNIKTCLEKEGISHHKISILHGRIIVFGDEGLGVLKRVFGIQSFSPSFRCPLSVEEIGNFATSFVRGASSFCVRAQRLDKEFLPTPEIERKVGAFIFQSTGVRVDLKSPSVRVGIEVFSGFAHVFFERIEGFGGLPVGIEGRACLIVEDERSVLAGLLMLRRGGALTLFFKNNLDASILERFSYGAAIKTTPFIPEDMIAVFGGNVDSAIEGKHSQPCFYPLVGFPLEKALEIASYG